MKYILFDMEWNTPAWSKGMIMNPVPLTGEIIEIGAVKLNEALEIEGEFRVYVVPQYYRNMNRTVQKLTGIRGKFLKENGVLFPEACRRFQEWCGEDFAFVSWGQNDLPMLLENLRLYRLSTENLPLCIDLQQLFARDILKSNQQCSLDNALAMLGEVGDEAHDALHDARNTAKVCAHLDLQGDLEGCVTRVFDVEQTRREYPSQDAVLRDQKLRTFVCPCCGGAVSCETWARVSGGRWMAPAVCPGGHAFILYLNAFETKAEKYRIGRMAYAMTEELQRSYEKKLERQRLQQSRRKRQLQTVEAGRKRAE